MSAMILDMRRIQRNSEKGRQVPRSSSLVSLKEAASVCQRLSTIITLLLVSALCGQTEAELFDLVRLSSLVNVSYTPGEVFLMDPAAFGVEDEPHERRKLSGIRNDLAVSSAKQPPIYLSAPKQISSTKEIHQHHYQPELHHQRHAIEHVKAKNAAGADLHVAADHYTKNSSKRKHKKVKETKKKRRIVKKKVVAKKYKKKVVLKPYKYVEPSYNHHHHHHHHHQPQVAGGKFYEYREVPKKGAWKFGYKRGNAKHMIERKEDGHKSHFKSVVKWMADKGKGHHLFDYNHSDHHGDKKGKQHHYHATAAAAKVKSTVAAPHKQHQHQHQRKSF